MAVWIISSFQELAHRYVGCVTRQQNWHIVMSGVSQDSRTGTSLCLMCHKTAELAHRYVWCATRQQNWHIVMSGVP
jgi:hypothetical protein